MQGALISDTRQTASYARPFATLLRHGRSVPTAFSSNRPDIAPHTAKQHDMRRVRIQRNGTMAEHNEKAAEIHEAGRHTGWHPFRVIVKALSGE